ncbi:MAG: type II secretion system F family protein [Candidatus Nanohaloarchaea archaeon]
MDYRAPEAVEPYILPLAESIHGFLPGMEDDIRGARMENDPEEYLAFSLFKSLQAGAVLLFSGIALGYIFDIEMFITGSLIVSPVVTGFVFISIAFRPKIKAKRISRNIEKNLPYALRHMLIEVSSGISLYQAMVSVSQDYEEASDEFEKIVSDIQGGKSQVEALEDSISRTQSQMYRRTMWQLINSIKSGANVTTTLETLVDTIVEEQKIRVKNYGEDLNPFVLMYLMLAVIFPSLGVTLMIVLSSFTGMGIEGNMFYFLIGGLIIFQIFFLNLIKSRRPEVRAA